MSDHVQTLLYFPVIVLTLLVVDQAARVWVAEDLADAAAFRAARSAASHVDAEGRVEADVEEQARAQAALALLPLAREESGRAPAPLAEASARLASELGLELPALGAAVGRTEVELRVGGQPLRPGRVLPEGEPIEARVRWRHPLERNPSAVLFADQGWDREVQGSATLPRGQP